MYKVFVNQDEIILTSKVPYGDKISIYDLKEISILEIIKLVKKQGGKSGDYSLKP